MHPWWSEDIFGKPTKPLKLTQTFLAFLTRGEKWTPERTPATEEIQKGHMANIGKLAEMKKLVAAGPFGDNGQLRGIFVFRVASLEEAKVLTATDPAVQAGTARDGDPSVDGSGGDFAVGAPHVRRWGCHGGPPLQKRP